MTSPPRRRFPSSHSVPWTLRLLRRVLPTHLRSEAFDDFREEYARLRRLSFGRSFLWSLRQLLSLDLIRLRRECGRRDARLDSSVRRRLRSALGDDASRSAFPPRPTGRFPSPEIIMRSFLQGWRYALRRLSKQPGFTAVTVLTMALGIGGSTAVFNVVHSILLQPLPYPEADRLVALRAAAPGVGATDLDITVGMYLFYGRQSQSFDGLGLYDRLPVNLTGEGSPQRVDALLVTSDLFPTLGVPPLLGRTLASGDDAPGAPAVGVLSHRLWVHRFGSDRAILGRFLEVDGQSIQVVGVMPEGFAFPNPDTQIWLPFTVDRQAIPPVSFSYDGIGRLKEGVSVQDAEQELRRLLPRMPETFPNITAEMIERTGLVPFVRTLKAHVLGDVGPGLWILQAGVVLVLLIACANAANLFLVRAESHRREIGVRSALGAGRLDMISYFLCESLALGLLGTLGGLGLALLGTRSLAAFGPRDLPRLHEVGMDAATLSFAFAAALAASGLFALIGLVHSRSAGPTEQLRDTSLRHTAGRSSLRVRQGLVVVQVALGLVLMMGAGLMARTYWNLSRISPGFVSEGVLTFRLSLPQSEYPTRESAARFFQRIEDELQSIPGVVSAGSARCLPLEGWCGGNPIGSPDSPLPPEGQAKVSSIKPVSPGFFRTLGIRMLEGRDFEARDHQLRTGAVVLSQGLAKRLFPNMDALGKRVYPSNATPDASDWYRVVGIADTVKRQQLDEQAEETLYVPLLGTDDRHLGGSREMAVAVKTTGDPLGFVDQVRQTVWSLDANLPVAAIQPMSRLLSRAKARPAFIMSLLAISAAVALALGAVGIFGVIAYLVRMRTREIGVRMALGACRADILGMVLKQGTTIVCIGIAAGVASAVGLMRLLGSLLYEVSPTDPATFGALSLLVAVVAILASALPARRAARVNPVQALRSE